MLQSSPVLSPQRRPSTPSPRNRLTWRKIFQKLAQFPSTQFTPKSSFLELQKNTFSSPTREMARTQPRNVAANLLPQHPQTIRMNLPSKSHENVEHYQRKEFTERTQLSIHISCLFRANFPALVAVQNGPRRKTILHYLVKSRKYFPIFRLRRYQ